MGWDLYITLVYGTEEGGLGRFFSQVIRLLEEAHLSGTVFTQQTISLAIIKRYLCSFDQQAAMERECVSLHFDVTALDIRY